MASGGLWVPGAGHQGGVAVDGQPVLHAGSSRGEKAWEGLRLNCSLASRGVSMMGTCAHWVA